MERDDLHAALGDLAAHVEDADGDALSVVRDRGHRRRRRRAGAVTGVTSALLVAIVLIGVAIAGSNPSPERISTGPAPASASTPTSSAGGACTQADLEAVARLPMPTPTVVTKSRSYKENFARLDPPPPGTQPKVPASVVWAEMLLTYPGADYDIVLGSYSALIPSTGGVPTFRNRLMWVVTGTHVPFMPNGAAFVPRTAGVTTVPEPACFFATQVTLFDASTGQELEQSTTGE